METKDRKILREIKERDMKWEKPKLIILVRGKPEEGVLLACKSRNGTEGSGGNCGPIEYPDGLPACVSGTDS